MASSQTDVTLFDDVGELCPFCGEEAGLELFEVWRDDRAFMVDACCESASTMWLEYLPEATREEWQQLFAGVGIPVRGVWLTDPGRRFTIDFGLTFCEVDLATAKAFVNEHHRHNPPPAGWRWGLGLRNDVDLVAVAMVGRAVSKAFDKDKVVEVNRVCVRDTDPRKLTWNACSMLYGAAAREAKRRGFERIVTYITEQESGTSLRAAGWTLVDEKLNPVYSPNAHLAYVKGRSWNRAKRPRKDRSKIISKWRWGKCLN